MGHENFGPQPAEAHIPQSHKLPDPQIPQFRNSARKKKLVHALGSVAHSVWKQGHQPAAWL
jgi:hypothetical protein